VFQAWAEPAPRSVAQRFLAAAGLPPGKARLRRRAAVALGADWGKPVRPGSPLGAARAGGRQGRADVLTSMRRRQPSSPQGSRRRPSTLCIWAAVVSAIAASGGVIHRSRQAASNSSRSCTSTKSGSCRKTSNSRSTYVHASAVLSGGRQMSISMRRSWGSSTHHVTNHRPDVMSVTTSIGKAPCSWGAHQGEPTGANNQTPWLSSSKAWNSNEKVPAGRLTLSRRMGRSSVAMSSHRPGMRWIGRRCAWRPHRLLAAVGPHRAEPGSRRRVVASRLRFKAAWREQKVSRMRHATC
jgi:hypothetical protein